MEIRILEPIPWQDGSWSESGDIIDSDELEPGILDQLLDGGAAKAIDDPPRRTRDAGEATEVQFDDDDDDDLQHAGEVISSEEVQDAGAEVTDDDAWAASTRSEAGGPEPDPPSRRSAVARRDQPESQGPAVSSQPRTKPVLPPVFRAVLGARIKQLCMTRKTPESRRSRSLLALVAVMKRQRQPLASLYAGPPPAEHKHQQFGATLRKKIDRIKGTVCVTRPSG